VSLRPWVVLVALFGALCLVVTIWVSIDHHPPECALPTVYTRMTIELGDGAAHARVSGFGPRMEAPVRILPGRDRVPITLAVDHARIGWLAVPDPLGHWIASNFDPSPQLARLPVRVLLGTVAIRAGRFEVGGDGR